MDGSPESVFSNAEALRAIGLDVPVVTEIAARLRALGVDVPASCYTVEQLCGALLSLERGARPC
jgi:energy-coupling factor transport system ATP-binding protein